MSSLPPSAAAQQQAELMRGFEHQRAGRTNDAAEIYAKLIAVDPRCADALHLLGTIKAQSGDPAEGERLIAAALAVRDDVPLMWSNYANVLALLERHDEAIASCEACDCSGAGFRRRDLQSRFAFDRTWTRRGSAGGVRYGVARRRRVRTGPARDLDGTRQRTGSTRAERGCPAVFDAVIASAPGNVDAISKRGLVLKELGRPLEAIAAFDRALELIPGHLDSILGRAHAQVLAGDVDPALAMMDRVLKVQPDNAVAHYIRAMRCLRATRRPMR